MLLSLWFVTDGTFPPQAVATETVELLFCLPGQKNVSKEAVGYVGVPAARGHGETHAGPGREGHSHL